MRAGHRHPVVKPTRGEAASPPGLAARGNAGHHLTAGKATADWHRIGISTGHWSVHAAGHLADLPSARAITHYMLNIAILPSLAALLAVNHRNIGCAGRSCQSAGAGSGWQR